MEIEKLIILLEYLENAIKIKNFEFLIFKNKNVHPNYFYDL